MFYVSHVCESSFHLIFLILKNVQQIVTGADTALNDFSLFFLSFDILLYSGAQYDV